MLNHRQKIIEIFGGNKSLKKKVSFVRVVGTKIFKKVKIFLVWGTLEHLRTTLSNSLVFANVLNYI